MQHTAALTTDSSSRRRLASTRPEFRACPLSRSSRHWRCWRRSIRRFQVAKHLNWSDRSISRSCSLRSTKVRFETAVEQQVRSENARLEKMLGDKAAS